jgi:glycosyltransferase involved in cell wall biosynthesis
MKILLVGPLPEPITGLSLSNSIVLKSIPKYTDNTIDSIDINYQILKEDLGKFSLKKVFHYIKQYKNLGKIKKTDKVYITIGQTFFGVLKYYPYFLVAKLLKKEIIVHLHGGHLKNQFDGLKGLRKIIFKNILSMTDKAIVLSKSLEVNFIPFIDKKNIYILENFVEDFLFKDVKEKDLQKLKIIYLSNLMKEKGILDLLDSLILLQKKNIPFEARIGGGMDEIMKDEIESKLSNLKDNVKYMGLVYKDDKKDLLNWGNVFVFPTYYAMEGQPISIFEAMATGNIILTTKHAGIPDVFKNSVNGFYIDKKSPKSIADKLTDMSSNLLSCKYISENNMNEAKEKYRVKKFILKLNDILEK